MKNIVFVIESLHLGGAEKSLVTLLQNLDYSQYKVDLITFHPSGFFKDLVPKEVNQVIIPLPRLSLKDRLLYAFKRNYIKQHHAQLFWPFIKNYFSLQEKMYDVAIAYNQGFATYFVHDFVQANTKYAWLNTDYEKAGYYIQFDYPYYKNYGKIITVSPEAQQSLNRSLQQIDKQLDIEIIKDISDAKIIHQQAEQDLKMVFDEKKTIVVSVGRLASAKGFDMAIDACKILVDHKIEINWYVIGEGTERQNLELQIRNLGLEDIFHLVGADLNPYPYMKACDLYVQTSRFEGLGLTVIEAAILAKPIVTTDFPSAYSILENEVTGLICTMSSMSIAENIERLIQDEALRKKLINNLASSTNQHKDISLTQIQNLLDA